jgi:predicted MFS family arabinose efflux permease
VILTDFECGQNNQDSSIQAHQEPDPSSAHQCAFFKMNFLDRYRKIPRSILLMISAAFFIHMINASFILILNIYLRKQGYADDSIAHFNSFRFLGVLFFAFPLGIFIKGKALKPFFLASSLMVPLFTLFLLLSIQGGNEASITVGFILWGVSFMILNVCGLPYIMRSAPEEVVSEAISLNFSTWSLATIVSGSLINFLSQIKEISIAGVSIPLDEFHIMLVILSISSVSFILVLFIEEAKPRSSSSSFFQNLSALRSDYDWTLIARVLVPNMIIATGAGLTIPFVNLFFNSVFQVDSDLWSLIGAGTALVVFLSTLFIPFIRRRFGFRVAILLPQSIAVFFLVVLATTQLAQAYSWAFYVALAAFILRQPLMNMAGPMTSELGMKYVGPRNQELISAISSSIWSASWFISAKIFQILRQLNMEYYQIFLITAAMYAVGVTFYHLLINDFLRREPEKTQGPVIPNVQI